MKHRNPFMVLFLSIITFGIYDLYWLVKTKTVLNKQTKVHTPTAWLLFMPVIFFIVIFIAAIIIGVHSSPQTMAGTTTISGSNQETANSAGFTVLILLFDLVAFIVIVPITFYWFFKFSKAINEYTSGELNTGVTFLLLWLLHFIGVIIVQDKFNDMLDAGTISSDGTIANPTMNPTPFGNAVAQPYAAPAAVPPATPIAPNATPTPTQPAASASIAAAPPNPQDTATTQPAEPAMSGADDNTSEHTDHSVNTPPPPSETTDQSDSKDSTISKPDGSNHE